jgi:hypothetical protein
MAAKKFVLAITWFFILISYDLFAQSSYAIVATKGKSALFVRPAGQTFNIGDVFIAKRNVNGQLVDVARVKLAILDDRYGGVKIESPISDNQLKKGDIITPTSSQGSFAETLSFLDQLSDQDSSPSTNPGTSTDLFQQTPQSETNSSMNTAFLGSQIDSIGSLDDILSIDILTSQPSVSSEAQSPASNGNRPASNQFGPMNSPQNITNSYLGLSLSYFTPISNTADSYAPGPQFGLQAITHLGFRTNLRISGQYTFLQPSSVIKSTLDKLGQKQNSSLTMLTASIQPEIINNFVLDLGVGYFRQHDEIESAMRLSSSTKNAFGMLTGLGYHWQVSRTSSLMLLGSGNFYFLRGDNATFLAFWASYFLAI